MKKLTMLLTILLSIFIAAPSVVIAYDGYVLSISDAADTIESNQASFTVSVTPAIQDGDTVTVDYTTGGGTATGGDDYTAHTSTPLTITGNGTTEAYATVDVSNDSFVEDTENFNVTIDNPTNSGGTVSITPSTASCNIIDPDIYTLSVASSVDVTEGGQASFRVSITPAIHNGHTVTVDYQATAGTATSGSDYTVTNDILTFNTNGQTFQNITVDTTDDSVVESTEIFSLAITNPNSSVGLATAPFGSSQGWCNILDNDTATFTINNQTVDEAAGTMTLTVSLDNPLDIAVDVDVTYVDVTATGGGIDYDSGADQVTFAEGDMADKTVEVVIIEDILVEATETFTASLGTATALGTRSTNFSDTGTGTITDNDTASVSIVANDAAAAEAANDGQFTVTMTNQSSTDTEISYNVTGNATSGSDYIALSGSVTISANTNSATIDVSVMDDSLVEDDETVTVTLSGITTGDPQVSIGASNNDTVTITDDGDTYDVSITSVAPDPAREGIDPTITFTVELGNVDVNGVVGTVFVDYATTDGTADGSDYTSTSGTLTFDSGTGPTLTVDVPILNDDLMESDETFDFTLSVFTGGGSINNSPATGTINDDTDKCGISIDGPYTVIEGSSITFNVTINQFVPAGQEVTVKYKTTDDTAVAEGDYDSISLSLLTFDAGDGPDDGQQIVVNTNDDLLYEIQEHFTVDLSIPSANAAIIVGQGDGYIDDDSDEFDVSIELAKTVTEGTDATVTFTVTLDQEVPGGTSVTFTLDEVTALLDSDYSVNTPLPTLNFAAGETTKDVVVNIIDDDLYEVPETFEVNITCAHASSTLSNGKGTCTINDDGVDTYIVSISVVPVPNPVTEANTTVTFTVSLDQEVPGGASVNFSLNDVTATLGCDYFPSTVSPLSFAAGETTKDIIVNIINDQIDEDSETFEVIITTTDPDAMLGNDTGTCTIADNDYTVTFNIDTVGPAGFDGGTVNTVLSLDQVVDHGTDCVAVTAAPIGGYRFVEWTGDYNGTNNPLTITNVTSDMTITANFIAIYTITATAGANGTISPSGVLTRDYGTDQTFTFDPNTCYEVDDVVVDGNSEGGEIREYTFTNITADHTIDVQFYHYDCTIVATAESGGTISPSGAIVVNCGGSQAFTITAGTDNEIEEVLVDGVAQAVPPSSTTYSYTFTNVKKDDEDTCPCVHYIVAKFIREPLSCVDISDVPLNALSRSAPPNIMFVLDDSGSMDWEFMMTGSQGTFEGHYYVFNDAGDNNYGGVLTGNDRLKWKSQCSDHNRMYYDPNVEYKPWATLTDADPDNPRSYPYPGRPADYACTFNLSTSYISVDAGTIVDDEDAGFTKSDGWDHYSNAAQHWNNGYQYVDDAVGNRWATWTPGLPAAGNYDVYAWWVANGDRRPDVVYTIHHNGVDTGVTVDQSNNGGQWNLLQAGLAFAADGSDYVTINATHGCGTGGYAYPYCADAIKFVPVGGGTVDIKRAHYYVWSASEGKPYLVIIDGANLDYYAVDAGIDDWIQDGEITVTASPPADVVTGRTYTEERQNFANWYSYYRRRELAAIAAVSNVVFNMQGVQIGFYSIHNRINQPVLKVKVGAVDETDTLLDILYTNYNSDNGTPLRRGLESVGRYLHQDDSQTGGIGSSPYASVANGGECQQSFAIVMTDGYWNGSAPSTGAIANNDGDSSSAYDGTAIQGDEPYGDSYSDTLADVAMYYYENDLSTTLGPEVPTNPWDDNKQQHLVTYGVSFGLEGSLNPADYDFETTFPPWPDVHSCGACNLKIDDLWHASVNGRGIFLSASNPNELVNSLLAIMQNIEERAGSASSVSVNGDELYTRLSGDGEILMFQSSYDTVNWTGDVNAYKVCTSLTGDCADKQIGDLIKTPTVWSANDKVESLNWNTGRKIVTYNGTDAGIAFLWAGLTTSQQAALSNDSTMLDYLRGDTTNEEANGGSFRDRAARLGDIVHSSPTFEDGVLYAGGNDGMLHAFAAADDAPYAGAVGGEELFAYVPNLVFNNLSQLADPAYTHKYFVDLTPSVKSGVNIGTEATPDLITLLVGGLGKGGKGYYALDVSDPTTWTTESNVAGTVMWEYPNSGVPAVDTDDLGYSYSRPAIVKCNDPDVGWIVIFGNGYNSQNEHGVLFILEPSNHDTDGDLTHLLMKIDTGVGGCNGLSTPVPIDVNYDKKVDYVYVGDLRGNVWKFDLTDSDYTNWEVAFNNGTDDQPLFQAQGPGGTTQPVTTMPDVMYHPLEHGYMVLFNTGKYLGESDISDTTAQSFYGIWDYGDDGDDDEYLGAFNRGFAHELSNQPITVTLLAQEVIPSEPPDPNEPDFWTVTINEGEVDEYDLLLRLTTDYEAVWETVSDIDGTPCPNPLEDLSNADDNHAGWYFDLPLSGERGTVDVMIRDGNVIAISFKPDDTPCSCGGFSVIHEMSAASGARLARPQFDINGDGVIDDNDMVNIGTDADPIWVVPTGIMSPGEIQPPAILIDPDIGVEIKYFSSSTGDIKMVKEKAAKLGICYWREFE